MKIQITLPNRETPGYWRRVRKSLELRNAMLKEPTPELCDAVIEFLLPFVTEPADRNAAREILLDASQTDFENMMKAFGGGNDTAIPPLSSTP